MLTTFLGMKGARFWKRMQGAVACCTGCGVQSPGREYIFHELTQQIVHHLRGGTARRRARADGGVIRRHVRNGHGRGAGHHCICSGGARSSDRVSTARLAASPQQANTIWLSRWHSRSTWPANRQKLTCGIGQGSLWLGRTQATRTCGHCRAGAHRHGCAATTR